MIDRETLPNALYSIGFPIGREVASSSDYIHLALQNGCILIIDEKTTLGNVIGGLKKIEKMKYPNLPYKARHLDYETCKLNLAWNLNAKASVKLLEDSKTFYILEEGEVALQETTRDKIYIKKDNLEIFLNNNLIGFRSLESLHLMRW